MEDAVKITAVAAFLFIVLLLLNYYESAFFGQFLTHSIHKMHSVPFFLFHELYVYINIHRTDSFAFSAGDIFIFIAFDPNEREVTH